MVNRRKAREYAFILLFEYKFQPEEIENILNDFLCENNMESQESYIRETVLGTVEKIDEIDELIQSYAKGWTVDRISVVCLTAMRLAVYELKYISDIPLNVSVNEAVSLVKKYDDEQTLAFVNGILDSIKKTFQ